MDLPFFARDIISLKEENLFISICNFLDDSISFTAGNNTSYNVSSGEVGLIDILDSGEGNWKIYFEDSWRLSN